MVRVDLRVILAWSCLALVVPLAQGRAPSPPATQDQTTLRITTHLVQVNVVVWDKQGDPVGDLKREDFVVLDEGSEQRISLFSVESNQRTTTSPQPLPPGTFSNRLEYHPGTPTSVTVILLDGLNTNFGDQAYAKQQIIKFLKQLQPQDRVALYALGSNLRVLQDFTSDAQTLLNALARHGGRISGELEASEPTTSLLDTPEPDRSNLAVNDAAAGGGRMQALDDWIREANHKVEDFYTARRAGETLRALEAIANHLAQLPGRKNLVWVSGSFPYWIGYDFLPTPGNPGRVSRSFSPEIERASRLLNNANLAVYPVDARGLTGLPEYNAQQRFSPNRRLQTLSLGIDTMNALADRTGGRAFYNTNDLQGAIRRAIDDSRVTYMLGYYPAHDKWDGKFRKIKVQVKRAGLHVRHRQGYFAVPEEAPRPAQQENALALAAWNPLDATAIRMTVRTTALQDVSLKLDLVIAADDVIFRLQDGRWAGAIDWLVVQLSPEGKNLKGVSHSADLSLKPETRERVLREGLRLSEPLEIVPGASQVRLVVRDRSSGAFGSVSIPLGGAKQLPKS